MTTERERKRARLIELLCPLLIEAEKAERPAETVALDVAEELLDAGFDITMPKLHVENGELGAGTVRVGDERHQCRILWAGEPGDLLAFYTALDGQVFGTAAPEQVSEYTSFGDLSGTWITSENVDQLGSSLGPSYETLKAETVATLIRNWARDHGVKV